MSSNIKPSHRSYQHHNRAHYIDYVKLGNLIRKCREHKYGKRSRSEVCRMLNRNGLYNWDQSQLAKFENGNWHISVDRLCELAMCLSVNPYTLMTACTYGNEDQLEWMF